MSTPLDQFVAVTGADREVGEQLLAACNNDVEAAVELFFDKAAAEAGDDDDDDDDAAPMEAEADSSAGPARLPSKAVDLVGSILDNARKETEPEARKFSGSGRALGSSADPPADEAASAAAATAAAAAAAAQAAGGAPEAERHNPKKVRIFFWADGFTVEDTTEEEAAAAPVPAGPRRTGIATLGSSRGPAPPMPKLPELRKYEDNKEFMEDLKRGIPPVEFREMDLTSGVPVRSRAARSGLGGCCSPQRGLKPPPAARSPSPAATPPQRPRPVDIMLGDMRPQPFPAEAAAKLAAMAAKEAATKPAPKPTVAAFSGQGYTLAGPPAPPGDADVPTPAADVAWPTADRPTPEVLPPARASCDAHVHAPPRHTARPGEPPRAPRRDQACRGPAQVDEAAPTTVVQVRLAGKPPARLRLNVSQTVGDLKVLVERKLSEAGEMPRGYVLSSGFPPKPLLDDAATLEAAGLLNAAVSHRWS